MGGKCCVFFCTRITNISTLLDEKAASLRSKEPDVELEVLGTWLGTSVKNPISYMQSRSSSGFCATDQALYTVLITVAL